MTEDINQWLEALGLGQYAPAFADNDIGISVLEHLTDKDFERLGFSLGHMRKLQAALMADSTGVERTSSDDAGSGTKAETVNTPEAERRQLTVLFCDLVGSTALSTRLDPEDMREIIRSYQDAVAGAVTRYGGHVAKYLGDGVLVYFGWPQAHEDQAERAIRAGLDAIDAVTGMKHDDGLSINARVGIATGDVVVGDLVGDAGRDVGAVTGETPNLAARLQGAAVPGQVVIDAGTCRLVGTAFDLEDLGVFDIKGFPQPVSAWNVKGQGAPESRFDAAHAGGFVDLIGREHELGLLKERWALAKECEGQAVLLSGEVGIGKSRMVQALNDAISAEHHYRLRYQCSPYHVNSAFYPVIQQLERAAKLSVDDSLTSKLDRLEKLLELSADDMASIAPVLAALLSLPGEDRYGALDLPPQQLRSRTIEVLISQLMALSQERPVLFVVEDAHWIDPTTEALIGEIVSRIQSAAVLVLVTHRPGYTPSWIGPSHQTSITLNRLGRRQVAEIVGAISGDELAETVIDRIVARADGVPLYVEELANSVLEASRSANHTVGEDQIPATLQASLVARLDRLEEAKELAQIGAVIGREFSHELLSAVVEKPAAVVDAALERLVRSELVFRVQRATGVTYMFKHALVQDAAYNTLLRRRREQLHARIVRVIETNFPRVVEQEPELLAHHLISANLPIPAIPYLLTAGRRASEHSGNIEAVAHLDRGMKLLMEQPTTVERDRSELEFCLILGPALIATKGYAAEVVGEVYSRSRELAQRMGDSASLFPANYGLWLNKQQSGQLDAANGLAEESLTIAEAQSNKAYLLQGHHAIWTTRFSCSDLRSCHHHAEQGVDLYDPVEHRSHAFLYGGHDPGVCAWNHKAVTGWFLGHPDQASRAAQEGKSRAERLDHPFSLVLSHSFSSWLYQYLRQPQRVLECCEAAASICETRGVAPHYRANASILAGWARSVSGSPETGVEQILEGISDWTASGQGIRTSYFLALLADAYKHDDQIELGLAASAQALDQAEASGEQKWRAEVLRLKGDLIRARDAGATEEAEMSYRQALTSARDIGAKSLELRTATNLAQLWADKGKRDDARDLLAPVYGWFSEGFDNADLTEAKALLDELS